MLAQRFRPRIRHPSITLMHCGLWVPNSCSPLRVTPTDKGNQCDTASGFIGSQLGRSTEDPGDTRSAAFPFIPYVRIGLVWPVGWLSARGILANSVFGQQTKMSGAEPLDPCANSVLQVRNHQRNSELYGRV